MKRNTTIIGILTFALLVSIINKGYTIGDFYSIGAREISLGNATVALATPFSIFNNQAALAKITNTTISLDYQTPYMIEGWSIKSLSFLLPSSLSTFGLSMQQQGIQNYNETRLGLTMAKSLGKKFSAGIQFNYFMLNFPEQGRSRGTFIVEFGTLYQTAKNLAIGIHIFNPAYSSIRSLNLDYQLPFIATIGMTIKPADQLSLMASISHHSGNPLNFGTGIEYQLMENFFLRCGISGKPIQHAAGIGYRWNHIELDFAFVHHELLGYTPSFSIDLKL